MQFLEAVLGVSIRRYRLCCKKLWFRKYIILSLFVSVFGIRINLKVNTSLVKNVFISKYRSVEAKCQCNCIRRPCINYLFDFIALANDAREKHTIYKFVD